MRHRLRAVCVGAVLAALVVGCGGTVRSDSERIEAASERTTERGTARVEFAWEAQQEGSMRCTGALDHARVRFQMRCTTDVLTEPWSSLGNYEAIVIGNDFYMRMRAGGRWLKSSDPESGDAEELNPALILQKLRNAAEDVERLREEVIRGVQTTAYRFVVDPEKADVPAQSGQRSAEVDVWIDGEDLVRRIRMTEPGDDELGDAAITVDFYDFGAEIDIQPPPPAFVRSDANETCSGGPTEPLKVGDVQAAFGRHGLKLRPETRSCVSDPDAEMALANQPEESRDGAYVQCNLLRSASDAELRRKGNDEFAQVHLANLECVVAFGEDTKPAERAAVTAALRDLESSLRARSP